MLILENFHTKLKKNIVHILVVTIQNKLVGSSNVQLSIDMDLRNFSPQMESVCGECDNEEDVVQTSPSSDFLTTNSQALAGSVCLKLSQQIRVKASLSYQKK